MQVMRGQAKQPAIAPVEKRAVTQLYDLYLGDLRGLLKAMEDGVTPNIGLPPLSAKSKRATLLPSIRSLSFEDLRPTLQQRYADDLVSLLKESRVRRLVVWGKRDTAAQLTQESLAKLWGVSQPAVSGALTFLMRNRYVTQLPRKGTESRGYLLTDASRLNFG